MILVLSDHVRSGGGKGKRKERGEKRKYSSSPSFHFLHLFAETEASESADLIHTELCYASCISSALMYVGELFFWLFWGEETCSWSTLLIVMAERLIEPCSLHVGKNGGGGDDDNNSKVAGSSVRSCTHACMPLKRLSTYQSISTRKRSDIYPAIGTPFNPFCPAHPIWTQQLGFRNLLQRGDET